jgi:hypothetical protein
VPLEQSKFIVLILRYPLLWLLNLDEPHFVRFAFAAPRKEEQVGNARTPHLSEALMARDELI